jgi:hypothetical protein
MMPSVKAVVLWYDINQAKASRVAMLHQLLEILQHCQATDFVDFLTGDESSFLLECPHSGVWAASREEVLETAMTKLETEKHMISTIWSLSGIHSVLTLAKDMKCISQYFCQHLILDIQQHNCPSSHKMTLKGILLHLRNAPAPNSRLSSEKIESAKAQRVPHPSHDPDPTPIDFFLFDYLKENFRRTSFTTSDD